MKRSIATGAAATLLCLAAGLPAAGELIPMSAWIHDPVIDSVDVSPDGKRRPT